MKTQSIEGALAENRLLSFLPAETLRDLEGGFRWCDYPSGHVLIEEAEHGREVYFVVAGHVHVINFSASGRVVSFATLGPGELFGELAALDGLPRSATVVAATDLTVAILPGDEFTKLVAANSDIALALLRRMAGIIRASDERVFNLSSLGAAQRVCLELLRLAEPDPLGSDEWVVHPVPTQMALAGNVGTTRETVARMIRRLSSHGIVERRSKALYIRDRKRLEARALQVKGEG